MNNKFIKYKSLTNINSTSLTSHPYLSISMINCKLSIPFRYKSLLVVPDLNSDFKLNKISVLAFHKELHLK